MGERLTPDQMRALSALGFGLAYGDPPIVTQILGTMWFFVGMMAAALIGRYVFFLFGF